MIKWSKRLYFGEAAQKERSRILLEIEQGGCDRKIHLIALPVNPQNLLEILPLSELGQDYYEQLEIRTVGVALSREEAMEVVRQIIDEVYRERGNCRVGEYLTDFF